MIQQLKVSKGTKLKPEIILLYNRMKGATDRYDHLISTCDVRRKANRYQLAVFYDMLNVILTNIFIIKRMSNKKLNHKNLVISLGMKLLDLDNCNPQPTLCCCSFPREINCKITNHFFVMRNQHPHGIKHKGHKKWQTSNQCGNAVKPGTLKQIVFDLCSNCFDKLNPPENFKIFEAKKNKITDDDENNSDENTEELEKKESKTRKRKHSELKDS